MKPPRTVYACQECGAQSPKWMGRCADCGAWNSLVEERVSDAPPAAAQGHRYTLPGTSEGATLYAVMRSSQMRWLRLPKPRFKPGQPMPTEYR